MDANDTPELVQKQAGLPEYAGYSRSTTVHLAAAVAAIVIWGISFAVTRKAVQEIPPIALAFLRFSLASLVLWPMVQRLRIEPEDRLAAFGLGFVGVTLYFIFENVGLQYTTASHGALIIATIPLATAVAESAVRRRLPTLVVLGGLITALVGVGLIIDWGEGGEASLWGDLLMFGAVFSWVGYTFLVRRLANRYPSLLITQAAMVVGAAALLPFAVLEAVVRTVTPPSLQAWGAVAYLGVFCSALAYLLWNRAIHALGVSVTNNLIYGIPLVGVLTGVLALGEPFTRSIALGGALILAGVVMASRNVEVPGG